MVLVFTLNKYNFQVKYVKYHGHNIYVFTVYITVKKSRCLQFTCVHMMDAID